jgi:RND family efflux transporter MFP subunit
VEASILRCPQVARKEGNTTMRAFILESFDTEPSVTEVPEPRPGDGELLVRVHASSVNPVDAFIAGGVLRERAQHEFPVTLGRDFAGTLLGFVQRIADSPRLAAPHVAFDFWHHFDAFYYAGRWDEARANRDRIRNLSVQQISSKSDVETAEANYEVALNRHEDALQEVRTRQALLAQRRAELKIARQQLEDTTLRAPFGGVIQERRANLGEYLAASAPVVTLVRIDPLRLRLEVSEREAPKIVPGQKVRVSLQGATNVYLGEIKRLSPALDEKSRMLRIEADVPNPGRLRPGAFVTADIVLNRTEQVVVVPEDAIVTFAGMEKVFAAQSGKAVEKSITTGQRMGNLAEVLNGLRAGENVVLEPGNLRNGQAVLVNSELTEAGHTNSVIPAGNGGSE